MFTGIIEEIGAVGTIKRGTKSAQLNIEANVILEDIHIGDSIAVNGVCLTVTSFTPRAFTADVMHETLKRCALIQLHPGSPVNLERAMPASGRFGGHIVSGHIDGTGVIRAIQKDGNANRYTISTTAKILRCIIEKGSIAIDGISLTVAELHENDFGVSIIPHTSAQTTLQTKKIGDVVNLENDCIAKYVEKLLQAPSTGGITKEFLMQHGF